MDALTISISRIFICQRKYRIEIHTDNPGGLTIRFAVIDFLLEVGLLCYSYWTIN